MNCYQERETKDRKWIWFLMIVVATILIVLFWVTKNKKKTNSDSEGCNYLEKEDDCVACCANENHGFDIGTEV